MAEYIEREALAKDGWYLQRHVYCDGYAAIETKQLKDIPAADVAPVRHGRWGKGNDCSECGCQPWFERDIHTLNYCPNCGALMDQEAL